MLIITIFLLALNTGADRVHMYGYRAPLENKVDHRCFEKDYTRAWVYFTDKNVPNTAYEKMLTSVTAQLNPSSLTREIMR